jgi:hypothetical protein
VTEGVVTTLAAKENSVKLGEPIRVRLRMEYTGETTATYDPQRMGTGEQFLIIDPDGNPVPYVGGSVQTGGGPIEIAPGSVVKLIDDLDLTTKFLFSKVGRHAIQFKGEQGASGEIRFPKSNTIDVNVEKGELPKVDKLLLQILPIAPQGWDVSKNAKPNEMVTPIGRESVSGCQVFLHHFGSGKGKGGSVRLWVTAKPAEVVVHADGGQIAEYLGRSKEGYFYYQAGGSAMEAWPGILRALSSALGVNQ